MAVTVQRIYVWAAEESNALAAIADPTVHVNYIAPLYADLIRCSISSPKMAADFGEVNRAILARWSFASLERIKRAAWKLVGGG